MNKYVGPCRSTNPRHSLGASRNSRKSRPDTSAPYYGQQAPHMWLGMYGHITLALSSSLFTLIFGGDRAALNASMVTLRQHLPAVCCSTICV